MGFKRRASSSPLNAAVLFEPSQYPWPVESVVCDHGLVHMLVSSSGGTMVRRLDSLKKRTTFKQTGPFRSLLVEGERWTASGKGGVYVSNNRGEDWKLEPIEGTDEIFHSIAKWDKTLWVASLSGKLAFRDESGWTLAPRPQLPSYRLVVAGDSLYAVGNGLWRLDRNEASLELWSEHQLFGLAETKEKTLLVGGAGKALYRRPKGGDWHSVDRDVGPPFDRRTRHRRPNFVADHETCIEIVCLEAGTLFVSATGTALHISTDDGKTLTPLLLPPGLPEHLKRFRFQAATTDQQGGAIVAGSGGLLVRVAPDPRWWMPVQRPGRQKRERARLNDVSPPSVDPRREDELLTLVFAEPDNDEPRLILGDWLTENGDLRGEFISIQCQLGRAIWGADGHLRGDSNPQLANVLALVAREKLIYKKHRRAWLAPFGEAVRKYRFRRGFLEGFSSNPKLFDVAETLFRTHPVEDISLEGLAKRDFERLKSITYMGLRRFGLPKQRMTNDELKIVIEAPMLSAIESLNLWGNVFGNDGARTLAARLPPHIKSLDVSMCGVTVDGVLSLLDSSRLGLKMLSVGLRYFSGSDQETLKAHRHAQILC